MKANEPNSGDDKKKAPKKSSVKKITPKKKVSEQTESDESSESIDFINALLQQSIDQYKDIIDRDIVECRHELEHLQNVATEFLDDFIIIGHTTDEKRVVIRYAPTPRGYDGLKELARDYLMRIVMNDPLEGGQEPPQF